MQLNLPSHRSPPLQRHVVKQGMDVQELQRVDPEFAWNFPSGQWRQIWYLIYMIEYGYKQLEKRSTCRACLHLA
jgi:hypothetical protein